MTLKVFVSVCLVLGCVFAIHCKVAPISLNEKLKDIDLSLGGDDDLTSLDSFTTISDSKSHVNSTNADKSVLPGDIRELSLTQWTAKQEIQPKNGTSPDSTRVKRASKRGRKKKKGRKGKKKKGHKGKKKKGKKGRGKKKGKGKKKSKGIKKNKGKKRKGLKNDEGEKDIKSQKKPNTKLKVLLEKIKEEKAEAEDSPELKKIFPVKVKIETTLPVNKQKLKEIKKLHNIKKETNKVMKNIDPCELKPCRHNGICEQLGSSIKDYKCVCPEGRKGKHCELIAAKSKHKKAKQKKHHKPKHRKPNLALIISLSVCIPLLLIGIGVAIFCICVKRKQKKMKSEYKKDKKSGKSPAPVPDKMTISYQLCGLGKTPTYTVDDILDELNKSSVEKLNELAGKSSKASVSKRPTTKKAKSGRSSRSATSTERSASEFSTERSEEEEEEEVSASDSQIEELADRVSEARLSSEQGY